jgi:hypothetical protein
MPDRRNGADGPPIDPSLRLPAPVFGKTVCSLGLASRGDSAWTVADVHHALEHGVDFLNCRAPT